MSPTSNAETVSVPEFMIVLLFRVKHRSTLRRARTRPLRVALWWLQSKELVKVWVGACLALYGACGCSDSRGRSIGTKLNWSRYVCCSRGHVTSDPILRRVWLPRGVFWRVFLRSSGLAPIIEKKPEYVEGLWFGV